MSAEPEASERRGGVQARVPPTTLPLHVQAGKIAVPELPRQFTPRPLLLPRLDAATAEQIILVSAPAGSGKTLLLADWVRARDDPPTAWVSLDIDDNDPRRLWSAVMVALLGIPSVFDDDRMQRMVRDMVVLGTSNLADELADTLDAVDTPVRLVLDDVHELTGREALHDLNQLIRRRPAGLRLVLSSRFDPPISVPRLRLEGRLHEVRADLLRFSPHDTADLLSASGLSLTRSQVAVLHARTEGWAAGLRLAVLALRSTDDPAAFLTEFSGDERSVADYLTGEILYGLTPDLQDFLRSVSLCSPLPAALAAELSSRADAERLLDDLRQQTALVERSGPGEYRIHALLRSYLAADLARLRPDTYRHLQVCAGRWWAARGQPVHALRHAERVTDRGLITDVLLVSGVTLFLSGDLGPLQRALAAVGEEARRADPRLALMAAMTHLEMRALPPAATELQNARLAWPEAPDTGLVALRLSVEMLASAFGMPGGPPVGLPPDVEPAQPELSALLHISRGLAEFAAPRGPHREISTTELERALELARLNDLGYLEVQSLAMLATLAVLYDDYRGMVSAAEQAVTVAARRGRHPSAWTAGPAGLLAYADLQGGDPVAAAGRSEEALGTWDHLPPDWTYMLRAVHGAAVADQGRRAAGLAEIRSARLGFEGPASPWMSAALALLEHRVALLLGSPSAADEVARWLAARVGETSETLLLKAWSEAAAGRTQVARAVVAPVLGGDVRRLMPHTLVEALLLEAEGALKMEDHDAGRVALERAVTTAESLDVIRSFAFAGPRVQELLNALSTRSRGSFGARLDAARAAIAHDAAAQLSERELAILALLPSLMTAKEIAAEFTVSVNTVKSHIRSIYAKLDVSSRREAVLQAHERGLLP